MPKNKPAKKPQFSVPWPEQRLEVWKHTVPPRLKKLGYQFDNPTDLGRTVLEEFMACFLSEDELKKLGMASYASTRRSGILRVAIAQARRRKK